MTATAVDDAVMRFLRSHIGSVMQLEVLLLLHSRPDRWWSANEVDRELRSSLGATRQHLNGLRGAHLLEAKDDSPKLFRFAPKRPEDAEIVSRLAELFRTRFHFVVDAIYKPRRDGIRAFAEAFKLKKDEEDNG